MIYNLVIYIYLFGVKVAGLFSAKPAKMVKGHREVFDILRNKIDKMPVIFGFMQLHWVSSNRDAL